MRFHTFNEKSLFTEVFVGRDWNIFRSAYQKHTLVSASKLVRMNREYVEDVLHLLADKLEVQFNEAVMCFQSGKIQAIQDIYKRRLAPMERSPQEILKIKDDDLRASKLEEHHKLYDGIQQIVKWDFSDLNAWVREQWLFALSIRHPNDDNKFRREDEKPAKKKRDPMKPRVEKVRPRGKGKVRKPDAEVAVS